MHCWHEAAPGWAEKVPAAHSVQDVAPCALNDPAAQGRHAAEEDAPLVAEYVPAGHRVHVEGAAAPRKVL